MLKKTQCITKSPNNDWARSLCSQIIVVHIKISHFNPLSDVGKLEYSVPCLCIKKNLNAQYNVNGTMKTNSQWYPNF